MDTSVKKVYKTVDLDYHHLMMSSDGIAFELVDQDKTDNHDNSDTFLVWTYLKACYTPNVAQDWIKQTGDINSCVCNGKLWFKAVACFLYSIRTIRRREKVNQGSFPPCPGLQHCCQLHHGLVLTSATTVASDQYVSYTTNIHQHSTPNPYDPDNYWVLMNNCCSVGIPNNIKDFDCKPATVNASVKGVVQAIKLTHKGTIKWSF